MKLIFATGNKGKIREVKKIFDGSKFEIISPLDIEFYNTIEETGDTFFDNAYIKAKAIFNRHKIPTIADDSGLMVDQLNGNPGVKSARYAGENCTYEDNNKKLLQELEKFPEPHPAQFICYAVYIDDLKVKSVEGILNGEIIKEYRGTNGFGFDPIFIPQGYENTLAEMTVTEKNKISHRSKAFTELRRDLEKHFS
ncbi:RdgB/HAM1 family non-canonical purine NTP pyrophosphatase [Bacteroidota bacterium]